MGGGVNNGAAGAYGAGNNDVDCATTGALAKDSLSSDSDIRSSSSETEMVEVALDSVGEEHQELARTADILAGSDLCNDGNPSCGIFT